MSFVMVPVPEEHVKEVTELVMRLGIQKLMTGWTLAEVEGILEALDQTQHQFVVLVARTSVDAGELHITSASTALDLPEPAVIALRDAVNEVCAARDDPELILWDDLVKDQADGSRKAANTFAIGRSVADLILQAADPHASP